MLRCIDGGSYGEIWLAQTALGEFRAVKLIHRDRFEDARPYERELEGIRRFEPVSRKHEGVIDILQVGHDEAIGIFYYVMACADDRDTGQDIGPENYHPFTLRTALHARAPLPLAECIEVARAIAAALGHLHQHSLVHRDIKPSNIVYIDGQPRLADIGLVTGTDATQSLVGTLGYIPREGPGKPNADLFSLGKVLYEMATGKDRTDYPEIDNPTPELRELNKIILKTCHDDPAQRYATAPQLIEDLDACAAAEPLIHATSPRPVPPRPAKLAAALALVAGLAWALLKPSDIPTGPVHLEKGLVAHYPFDGIDGNASDITPHAQIKGATPAPDRHGKPNHSYHFGKGHILLPQTLATQFGGAKPISVCVWLKIAPKHSHSNHAIFGIGEAAYFKSSGICMVSGQFAFSQFLDAPLDSGVPIADNRWHHCAATYDGKKVALYVDGKFAAAKPIKLTVTPKQAILGARYDLVPHETWHGTLDNLRIYNRALNPAEIYTLFQQEKP